MSHVKTFKSFTKQQEKLVEPQKVEEQGTTPNIADLKNKMDDAAVAKDQAIRIWTDAQNKYTEAVTSSITVQQQTTQKQAEVAAQTKQPPIA